MERKSHSGTVPEVKHNAKASKPKKKKINIENFPISDEVLEKASQLGNKEPVEKEASPPLKTPKSPKLPTSPFRIPSWLFALLLIFALSILGLGLNALTKSPIPFWLLFGFSIIFPVEKWFRNITSNKAIGKLYRLILNLVLLATFGLLIWSGFELVAKQLASTPLISSAVFLAELAFFIWIWRKVAKNRWRWPSMKLTILLLVCIAVVFTFAGVPPLSIYKDNLVIKWEEYQDEQATQQSEQEAEEATERQKQQIEQEAKETARAEEQAKRETEEALSLPSNFNSETGTYRNYYLGLVDTPGGVLSGNDCYGEFIVLVNNSEARNPTYSELVTFLKADETDKFPYQPTLSIIGFYYGEAEDKIDLDFIRDIVNGITEPIPPKVCSDFAERLHNNAETAGIRAGYISLDLVGYTDPSNLGIPSDSGHALNVFETTDRGLVFIDSTSSVGGYGPFHSELTTNSLEVGQSYNPKFLFPTNWIMPSGQMLDYAFRTDGNNYWCDYYLGRRLEVISLKQSTNHLALILP